MQSITQIDDTLEFGKYKGLSIGEVILINPSYIGWLVTNVSGELFAIEDEAMQEILEAFPDFVWGTELEHNRVKQLEEQNKIVDIDEPEYEDDDYDYRYTDNDYDYEDRHFGLYAGTYAQDVEGYSDEEINTIFDGEPDAYWNID